MMLSIFFSLLVSKGFALINGKPLVGEPDVVRLVFENGWVCSGVYLNPFTILTAAHCLVEEDLVTPVRLKRVLSENDQELEVKQVNSFVHPDYRDQFLRSRDVGIITTSANGRYRGSFALETKSLPRVGRAVLFGCGRTEAKEKIRARLTGENGFLRIGAVLFFEGRAKTSDAQGGDVMIAANDSGGPIVDKATGKIIAVETQTTAAQSFDYGLAAIGLATSVQEDANRQFIESHLGSPQMIFKREKNRD